MNSVISLCHFCDNHGPSVLFTSQSFQNGKNAPHKESLVALLKLSSSARNSSRSHSVCEACQSVEGYFSNDHENGVTYVSSERPLEDDVSKMMEQAAVRSLSCEVVQGKEGQMYFGDDIRGHVLSYTFYLQDSQARGFHRWFSIIVFMKDRHFLLNSWSFFQEHISQLVSHLQSRADKVYIDEQKKCCERAVRLSDTSVRPVSRPITTLTDSPKLFAQLHMWFTWMLSTGGSRLGEYRTPSADFSVLQRTENGFVVIDTPEKLQEGETKVYLAEVVHHLRLLLNHIGLTKMTHLLYALLTGRQLVVRGPQRLVQFLFHLLKWLLPRFKLRNVDYIDEYMGPEEVNLIGLPLSAAVPVASTNVERVDILPLSSPTDIDDGGLELGHFQYIEKSGGGIPSKLPGLLNEILVFLNNPELSDEIAYTLISTLVHKWTVIATSVKKGKEHAAGQDITPLLMSLGVQDNDHYLLNYWTCL